MAEFEFHQRWLAESLHQLGVPPSWQRGHHLSAQTASGTDEAAVLRWASSQPESAALGRSMRTWRARLGLLLMVVGLIVFVAAWLGAWATLGTGERAINVLWVAVVLLGLPTLSLLALMALGLRGRGEPAALGQWVWRGLGALTRDREGVAAMQALSQLLASKRALLPALQLLSHGLWALALLGVCAGLTSAFALRSYQFVWETTVLPVQVFVAVVGALGAPLAAIGFAVPDAASVAASTGAGLAADDVRRAWASWLFGTVVVYGLLPRAVLAAICGWQVRLRRRRIRLDLVQPFYQRLLGERARATEAIVVEQSSMPPPTHRVQALTGTGRGSRIVAYELSAAPSSVWSAHEVAMVDEGPQREGSLCALSAHPAARLLVLIDAARSPDRGFAVWLQDASAFASHTAVCLLGRASALDEKRQVWCAFLARMGVDAERIFHDEGLAECWLREAGR